MWGVLKFDLMTEKGGKKILSGIAVELYCFLEKIWLHLFNELLHKHKSKQYANH